MIEAQAEFASGAKALGRHGAAAFAGRGCSPRSDRRWLAVADIRLDNRQELIGRLGARALPHEPDDVSILLASWIAWGPASLDHLVGEFAFAIYDQDERTLILARDCSGDRPLLYARYDDRCAFASMPSGLRAIAPHPPNLLMLAAHLDGEASNDDTVFAGIKRVRPGELVRITPASLTRVRHWQPRVHHSEQPGRTDPEYVDQYRHLLTQAVECRLPRDDSPVASQLSSGWDSSAVTSTAALLRPGQVVAFTSAPVRQDLDPLPRGRIADESAFAALTAGRHGIDHVIVRQRERLLDVVRRQSSLIQMPAIAGCNLAWWEAIRTGARERGATHLLTGELGNLTLNAGGLPTLSEWVKRSMWLAWWKEARAAARRPDVRWRGILVNSFGHHLPPALMSALRHRLLSMPPHGEVSLLRKEWREQLALDTPSPPRTDGDCYLARLEAIRRHDAGVFRKAAFAQAGIIELDPTADRRLIEFSLALPPGQLFRGGQSRPLARAALADRVPAAVLDLKVRGLQAADWYLHFDQREAQELLEEIEPHPTVRDLLDINRMKRAIEDWPDRDWNSEAHVATYRFKLLGALATGIFLNQFSAPVLLDARAA